MFQAVGSCFSNYVTFTGRARRSEYWWFALFNFIVGTILAVLQGGMSDIGVSDLYTLAIFLPTLAVSARRLHDIGRSGWWQLLIFVPLVGAIILLVWALRKGEYGPNAFGEDPVALDSAMSGDQPTMPRTG